MTWLAEHEGLALAGAITLHGIGLLHVLHALMTVRTSQGAVGWIVSLITFPYLAVPLYWIAGSHRFVGYVRARRSDDAKLRQLAEDMHDRLQRYAIPPHDAFSRGAEQLGGLPFTRGNALELLIDGEETFEALFEAITKAERYLLVSFFIVKNDRIGERFKNALIERARAGVKVYFLFDEVGSHGLKRSYVRELRDAGVECQRFGANRSWRSRFQINFRNHRKIVVVDGQIALLGGLNVGDEYLGRSQKFGPWRDTHLRISGPAVQAVQLVFLEDWFWATSQIPELHWDAEARPADQHAAIIPTGPADPADSWQLVVAEAANTAHDRLWIASPYFVPDEGVLTALQTAALRGVDVRIMIAEHPDHLLVWLSAFSYYENILPFGVKLFRYTKGFLHQKVMLIDDRLACVGTANLDNRSFRLNFEISALSNDENFIEQVTEMLEADFAASRAVRLEDFTQRSFFFRAACRAARLFSPLQ